MLLMWFFILGVPFLKIWFWVLKALFDCYTNALFERLAECLGFRRLASGLAYGRRRADGVWRGKHCGKSQAFTLKLRLLFSRRSPPPPFFFFIVGTSFKN